MPSKCMLCGDSANDTGYELCKACLIDLPDLSNACEVCASPLVAAGVCGRCLQNPPAYDRVFSPFSYVAPMDYLIQRLKFAGKLSVARLLGELLGKQLAQASFFNHKQLPEVIIPVPLHPSHLRRRGFNQAMELARPISKMFKIPIDYRASERIRETKPQSELAAKDRRDNVKGVFKTSDNLLAKHVLIIDDVMTTGSTVEELAKSLRCAGVERIDVVVCARASLV